MRRHGLAAYIINGTDPHLSEYIPARWETRAYISGFTGSAGTVVITAERGGLWTDARYFLQAGDELENTGIDLYKMREEGTPAIEEWLATELAQNEKVGVNGSSYSVSAFRKLQEHLNKSEIAIITEYDLIQEIWEDRPAFPDGKAFEVPAETAGASCREKIEQVRTAMKEKNADTCLVCALDEIAWLFNLRGTDVEFNPVWMAYAVVEPEKAVLFAYKSKITEEHLSRLNQQGVELKDYNEFSNYLSSMPGHQILSLDPGKTNYNVYRSLPKQVKIVESTSLVTVLKSRKNSTELKGFRQAMVQDGRATVNFLYWLNNNIGKEKITEYTVREKLREFRSQQPGFAGESFCPIVGYGENGAVVHYHVEKKRAKEVLSEGILLFDSGGQYNTGTTDTTRTVAVGAVTENQQRDFTLVLKGMIQLSMAKFPKGTRGYHIDILARNALWRQGLDYKHGTGHGVGFFLNVHEGPMSIRQEFNNTAIEPGMVISNEPGMYRTGEYGIRIENMIACIPVEVTEFGEFFAFETLTLCPIDTRLIKTTLLSREELEWMNTYHQRVFEKLSPGLEPEVAAFLRKITAQIKK